MLGENFEFLEHEIPKNAMVGEIFEFLEHKINKNALFGENCFSRRFQGSHK